MKTMTADEKLTKIGIPTRTGCADMAKVLGVTPRRLRQLVSEGHVEGRLARDEYDVHRTIATYLSYCRLQGGSR